MNAWIGDFGTRVREVDGYFAFLVQAEAGTAGLALRDEYLGQPIFEPLNPDLLKTLKAAAFLILYNLVESSMRNAIVGIFDELGSKNVPFDDVRMELKLIAIRNVKRSLRGDLHTSIRGVATHILTVAFDSEGLFAGNLDAKAIRETANEYGFSSETDRSLTKDGRDLMKVKANRNDLSHGNKSFNEVGRDYDIESLVEIQRSGRRLPEIDINEYR